MRVFSYGFRAAICLLILPSIFSFVRSVKDGTFTPADIEINKMASVEKRLVHPAEAAKKPVKLSEILAYALDDAAVDIQGSKVAPSTWSDIDRIMQTVQDMISVSLRCASHSVVWLFAAIFC